MGRPPKSTAEHKLTGTYRPDRHGDRLDAVDAMGAPAKPDGLDGDASWAWDQIVAGLPEGVLGSVDVLVMIGTCRWWSLWKKWDKKANGSGKGVYRATILATVCWKQFSTAAAKLGLSPGARAGLHVTWPERQADAGSWFTRQADGSPPVISGTA